MSTALSDIIRELVLEHVIEEKFGQKIGQQPSLAGVRDERNLTEDDLTEMYPGEDIDLGEGKKD